jgi:hypothetical protein
VETRGAPGSSLEALAPSAAEMRIRDEAVAFDSGCAGEEVRGGTSPEVRIVHSETGLPMRSQCKEGNCAERLAAQKITVHGPNQS